jgi:hypothetical protein
MVFRSSRQHHSNRAPKSEPLRQLATPQGVIPRIVKWPTGRFTTWKQRIGALLTLCKWGSLRKRDQSATKAHLQAIDG